MRSERKANSSPEPTTRNRRDAGFTLPELLVSIIVLGSIVAVLSSAIIVTFQQRDNTEGRLNVSRAEQNISLWVPADLASAGSVPSTDPKLSPCSLDVFDTTGCPANVAGLLTGSNALFLTWTDEVSTVSGPVTVTTNVSYHFKPNDNGLFDLLRIECSSTEGGPWTCEVNTVLHDLVGPPPPDTFVPGVTKPSWVLQVSVPLPPEEIDPDAEPDPTYVDSKNASRVVVTINGGGDVEGSGGGINQISITAGGTTRNTLPPNSVQHAPTFSQTQSRCGGPITLVVDESNSVGTDVTHVRDAVAAFIEALAGTPVQIQVVRFHTRASILGDSSAWTKYYNMTNEADVTALLAAVPQLQGAWTSGDNGGTNWEDAIFRTFYSPSDVSGAPNTVIPKTVVFFTDGVPTFDRIEKRGAPGVLTTEPALPGPGWFASVGNKYSQVAFDRADYWADIWRAADDTKLIGVGVGEDIDGNSLWMDNPRAGYHTGWQERSTFDWESYWRYEQLLTTYDQLVTAWQQSTFTYQQSTTTYEERQNWDEIYWDGNSWESTNKSTYHANNVNPGWSDGWYRDDPSGGWVPMTLAQYNANNTSSGESDGVRTSTGWATVSQTTYNDNNTTNDSSDGWRRVSTGTGWTAIDQATYNANNTTSDSSDGFQVTSTWTPTDQATYNAYNTTSDSSDGWRTTTAWTVISPAVYNANNTTSDSTDGYRRVNTGTWSDISKADYEAGNTTNDSTDGFRRHSPSGAWVQITEAEYNARNTTSTESDGVRVGGKEYSLPYTDFDNEVTESTPNEVILARFISGNDNGVPWLGALNTNEREANMFVEPNWALVPEALKAVALGECGATLTLQTKLGSAAAVDPFTYQNSAVSDSNGTPLEIVKKTVVTNISSPARTFDFDIADGTFRTVEITPVDLSDLTEYTGGTWSCKAGVTNRPVTTFAVPDSVFSGIRVVVGANEAVSCVHTVTAS